MMRQADTGLAQVLPARCKHWKAKRL